MIDNPRFRGMTLPQARKLEEESRGFRDLSDEQVWALRMVHAHDCTQRPVQYDRNEWRRWIADQVSDLVAGDLALADVIGDALADDLAALAERPAEPAREASVWRALDGKLYARLDAIDGWLDADDEPPTGAVPLLAERPAGPDPDPDLVAAMYDALQDAIRARSDLPRHQKHRYSDIEAMAAVAQARIDAAVNAERDRIRLGLGELLGQAPTGAPYTFMCDALAVVDEGGQR